ncbi:MAG: C40 family peptidase [Proteobacteria bacterium]|nr:C40 family peptidase [Pseudomonadota bacterium]
MKIKKKIGVVAIVLLFLVASGCAPKKISLYESLTEIRNNIVQSAMELHGKPYKGGAKGPDAFDCSGLVHYVYKKSDIVLPITAEGLNGAGHEIPRGSVLPGDLVFFKIKRDLHVGIMISKGEFVHASKSKGVTIDDINSGYWSRNLQGFRCIL